MSEYLLILVGAALVNNFVLVKFLGLCPFFGSSQRMETAVGLALATLFVLTLSSSLGYLIDHYLLTPFGLQYARALVFILIVASLVQLTEIVLRKIHPLLHTMLGIFLPLITSNCAVLGVTLLAAHEIESFTAAVFLGLGAASGFALVLILFSSLRKQLEASCIPKPFQGPGIAMITAGIMSLAFMGFEGLTVY